MRYIKLIIAGLLCITASAKAQEVSFECNFTTFKDSTRFTVLNLDNSAVRAEDYKVKIPNGSWRMFPLNASPGIAIFSPSRTQDNVRANDWLITPQIAVESEDAVIRWMAKAVHYTLRDGYKVMVSTKSTNISDFEQVFSIEEEDYFEQTRIVSLSKYKGQNIYVAFVNDSYDKYMICIDDIFVGVPSTNKFITEDNTFRTAGADEPLSINGIIRNVGKTINVKSVECVSGDMTYSTEVNRVFTTNDEIEYSFEVPVTIDKRTIYTLSLKGETEEHSLLKDSVYVHAYPRTFVAEEYSGPWCNSCPKGTLFMYKTEHRYKSRMIPVLTLNTGYGGMNELSDLTYTSYLDTKIFNLPSVMFDRKMVDNVSGSSIHSILNAKVHGKIDIKTVYTDNDNRIKAVCTVEFAENADNSNDRYRISFGVTEKTVDGYAQKNSMTTPYDREYYFLPDIVKGNMNTYYNLTRGTKNAIKGVENSLPVDIVAKTPYVYEYEFDIPGSVLDRSNISIVAYLLDTKEEYVVNAAQDREPAGYTSVSSVPAPENTISCLKENGIMTISLKGSSEDIVGSEINIYNTQGIRLASHIADADGFLRYELPVSQPLLIQWIKGGMLISSRKVVY